MDGMAMAGSEWRANNAAGEHSVSLPLPPSVSITEGDEGLRPLEGCPNLLGALFWSAMLHGAALVLWAMVAVPQEGDGGVFPGAVSVSFRNLPLVIPQAIPAAAAAEIQALPATMNERAALSVASPAETKSSVVNEEPAMPAEDEVPITTTTLPTEVAASSGAKYYRGSELTRRPRPLDVVDLSYPLTSDPADAGRSGSVRLRLLLNDMGEVDQAVVVASDLPPAFQETAVQQFSRTRFSPGMIQDLAVRSQMLLEVTFEARPPDSRLAVGR